MEIKTNFFIKEYFVSCRKIKTQSQASFELRVCLWEDLMDPSIEEPPSVSPSRS